jgi:hypothetical protein
MTLPTHIIQHIVNLLDDLWTFTSEKDGWAYRINRKNDFIQKLENHYESRLMSACYTWDDLMRTECYYFTMDCINDPKWRYTYSYSLIPQFTRSYCISEPYKIVTTYLEPYYLLKFEKTENVNYI